LSLASFIVRIRVEIGSFSAHIPHFLLGINHDVFELIEELSIVPWRIADYSFNGLECVGVAFDGLSEQLGFVPQEDV